MVDANLEWVAISRLGIAESAGDGWLNAIHPDDRGSVSECIANPPSSPDLDLNVRVVGAGGSLNWFRGHVRCFDDPIDHARLLTFTSVGAHRSNEARLLHLASHDGLTGLANRARFVSSVTRTLEAGTDLVGMLFIDLDHFKVVNDRLGHRFGDEVLRAVCTRIESAIRSTDVAARLGGDEIGVFCPHVTSPGELFALAERIGAASATPFTIEDQTVIIDASIGVSYRSDSCRTAEALIDSADRAMYRAKSAGGGRWAILETDATPAAAGAPVPDPLPDLEVANDLLLSAARADIDHAEERIMLAWRQSTRLRDFKRSSRLLIVREALRRAGLLLQARPNGPESTAIDEENVDPRADQLQSAFDGGQAVAQAGGMIAQRIGSNPTESIELLRSYATASDLALVTAARMVVNRDVDIDTLALVGQSTARNSAVMSSSAEPPPQANPNRRRSLHQIFGEHSAAVFASAKFIGDCDATRVTEQAFEQYWRQHVATTDPASERSQLLTIAHRLAMRTAGSTARGRNDSRAPLDPLSALVRRGQAIERTLACVHLSSMERSVAALVVYGRCTYAEVARLLGEPEADVNQQLTTALRHLRTALSMGPPSTADDSRCVDVGGVVQFDGQPPVAPSV